MRRVFRRVLDHKGLHLYHRNDLPFGANWQHDIRALMQNHRGPVTAFDVGANTGQTMRALAAGFDDIRIFSFEPVARSFEALQKCAAQLEGARALRLAMSDEAGELRMAAEGHSGLNRVLDEDESIAHTERVAATTADIFMAEQQITTLDILKIDVEGHEMSVLRGAAQAIEEGRIAFVLCECEFQTRDDPHGDFFEIFGYLSKHNYRLVSFYTGGVDQNGWRFGDVLFKLSEPQDGGFMNAPLCHL